ncbi:MAG TPA: hypothetical protein VFE47_19640 [Tepidisphaeraceae bacterium]|nr:hypothetical protein [Tepidisphaeraceae bacterium]
MRLSRAGAFDVASMIIAYHIILSGYGTWLSNDLRGSGSEQTRKEELDALGPVHQGRQHIQPPMQQIRAFFREAEPLLDFPVLWFSAGQREAIARGIEIAVAKNCYTVFAFAICGNHSHAIVRRHRHTDIQIRDALANSARQSLIESGLLVDPTRPVWSSRPYAVYLNRPEEVVSRINYVVGNPEKEGLPRQTCDFVKPYDGWNPPGIIRPR